MIGRQPVIARHQSGTGLVGQLLGMQLDRQPQALGGAEHALGLGWRKANFFAKCIDRIDQSLRRQRRQHLLADRIDIGVGLACIFRRQRMRAEESGFDRDRQAVSDTPRHLQHFCFRLQRQAVTGFDFNRGHALGQQAQDARQALLQ